MAHQSMHNVFREHQKCKQKEERNKKLPPPTSSLAKSTKSIMDTELSSMYTLTHSKKLHITDVTTPCMITCQFTSFHLITC